MSWSSPGFRPGLFPRAAGDLPGSARWSVPQPQTMSSRRAGKIERNRATLTALVFTALSSPGRDGVASNTAPVAPGNCARLPIDNYSTEKRFPQGKANYRSCSGGCGVRENAAVRNTAAGMSLRRMPQGRSGLRGECRTMSNSPCFFPPHVCIIVSFPAPVAYGGCRPGGLRRVRRGPHLFNEWLRADLFS